MPTSDMLKFLMAAQSLQRVAVVISECPGLIKRLEKFNLKATVLQIGGLFTFPELHPNTLRIEMLQHLALIYCRGKETPSKKDVADWLNRYLLKTSLARLEDPSEDVFISNVITRRGNNLVFEGTWESHDFYLQQLIDVCATFHGEQKWQNLLCSIEALLALSNEAATRAGLMRFCPASGEPKGRIAMPKFMALKARSACVHFTSEDLAKLQIDIESLSPFILHPDSFPLLNDAQIGSSILEQKPLLRFEDGIVFALPTASGTAAKHYAFGLLKEWNEAEHFSHHLQAQQGDLVFNEALRGLDADILFNEKLPEKPRGLPPLHHVIATFDSGKFAHVILLQDHTVSTLCTSFTQFRSLNQQSMEGLNSLLSSAAATYSTRSDYSGGLTIIVCGGLGGAVSFWVDPLTLPNWHVCFFGVPDFMLLDKVPDFSLLTLWKLKEQVQQLAGLGVTVKNANGDINLLADWHLRRRTLVPLDFPIGQPVVFVMRTDSIGKLREFLRNAFDSHAAHCLAPRGWHQVQRKIPQSYFKELEWLPIYASRAAAREGVLAGVVETAVGPWWIFSEQRFEGASKRHLQYMVWNAAISWLSRLADVLISERKVDCLENRILHIRLLYDDIPEDHGDFWKPENGHLGEFSVDINTATLEVVLKIPNAWFRALALPDNRAEIDLVAAVTSAILRCAGAEISLAEARRIAGLTVKSPNARFLHVTSPKGFREHARSFHQREPRLIKKEDRKFSMLGTGRPFEAPAEVEGREIRGWDACNQFLNRTVDAIWNRIRARLERLDRSSLINSALQNIEAVACDSDEWQLTASALLALYRDEANVLRAAHKRDSERQIATLTSRIAIEMGLCTCPLRGGRTTSHADLDLLLANIEQLIASGHNSDAIRGRLTNDIIALHPNSSYSIDTTFYETVINPFLSGHFSRMYFDAAAAYASRYKEEAFDPDFVSKSCPPEFLAAFHAHFEVTPQSLFQALFALEDYAFEKRSSVFTITRHDLTALWRSAKIPYGEITAILTHFTLAPRPRWDESNPPGFSARDWYPWKHYRRLSLLSRPLIQMDEGENPNLIIAPAVVGMGFGYVIDGALNGSFPNEYFKDGPLRCWVGKVNDEEGVKFESHAARRLNQLGIVARASVQMTELGASKSLGDVDVLGWSEERRTVYVLECKNLKMVRTVGEIAEQLKRFRKDVEGYIAKHQARCNYLQANTAQINRALGVRVADHRFASAIVTNATVPLQYVVGLPCPVITVEKLDLIL